jgi:EAL domain-containing protein (putative c-di-GMP-specific phosphodiesterase class I)
VADFCTPLHIKFIGEKILTTLNRPYSLASREYRSTASIGATMFGENRSNIEDLLKQADIAMYQAKADGRDALRFFDPHVQTAVREHAALEADLRLGIEKDQFLLFYQPQIDEGRLINAEALIRWQHPRRGLVLPSEFIPLAEEVGLILPLGNWVLEAACIQMVAWATQPEMVRLTMAVNVSARQFFQTDFAERVLEIIKRIGADPKKLTLEITESTFLDNTQGVISKMVILKEHGIRFSLDDFGTGYSSLSYLKNLPLNQIKLDRSFVLHALVNPKDAAIARTIVALTLGLGLAVIAEGVETEEQRVFFANQGCHACQGYLFGPAMPANDFGEYFLRKCAE